MAGRILFVDDAATNRIVMKVRLSAACYDVLAVGSGEEALRAARDGRADIVIMDTSMPGMSGAEVCRRMRADPATVGLPIILLTDVDDAAERIEGLAAGADDFLTKPVDEVALLARVRSLLRSRDEERDYEARGGALLEIAGTAVTGFGEGGGRAGFATRGAAPVAVTLPADGRIAIVGSETAAWTRAQRDRLHPVFREAVTILDREAVLALRPGHAPDLFLIDADVSAANEGLRLMSELRSRPATRHAAFIMLLPKGDTDRAATALDLGAADVVYHPFPAEEVAMRVRTQLARKKRADRMRDTLDTGLRMAVIDPLTGLHNRRYGLNHLDRVATRCRAQGLRAGVILMDIDHFKRVNDTHGHPAGDRVLATVAQVLTQSLRAEDLVARIGGEEFLAVLPDADLGQIRVVAERLRAAVEALEVPIAGGGKLSVTLSLGVAMLEDRDDASAHALSCVDRALYSAKDDGRNRVRLAQTA